MADKKTVTVKLVRSISQRLDATMVRKTSAIKRHFFNASSLCFFSNTLADGLGCSGVATLACATQGLTHFDLGGRSTGQHLRAVARNHAGVNMQIGAIHRQACHTLRRDADTRLTGTAKTLLFFGQHTAAPYFFLVSLIVIFSSA